MSTILELEEDQIEFLRSFLPISSPQGATGSLPHVTLTYACSLDGLISLSPGVRTTLSGAETKSMTHFLRLHHDVILVGVGTAVADNPSLNCRYPGVTLVRQPRPVIIDPKLRWSPAGAAVVDLAEGDDGKIPWIVSGRSERHSDVFSNPYIMVVQPQADGLLDWRAILLALKAEGIDSVMIEGGATILNALLMQPELVTSVIVTVAPTWLGQGGVHVSPAASQANGVRQNSARLTDTSWKQFGADAVLCGRLQQG